MVGRFGICWHLRHWELRRLASGSHNDPVLHGGAVHTLLPRMNCQTTMIRSERLSGNMSRDIHAPFHATLTVLHCGPWETTSKSGATAFTLLECGKQSHTNTFGAMKRAVRCAQLRCMKYDVQSEYI